MNRITRHPHRVDSRIHTPGRNHRAADPDEPEDTGDPWEGIPKRDRIDIGLALLGVYCQPNTPLTLEEIAGWCGCSYQAIRMIQESALRKLRVRLGPEFRQILNEL